MILSLYGCPVQTFITPNPPVKIRAVSAAIQAFDQDEKIPFYGDFYEILILLSHPHGCVLCGLAEKRDIYHVFLCALQAKISLGSSRDAHWKKSCEGEYDNLHAFVSDHRLMAVINGRSLAAAQTTGKTAVEKVFIAALFILQCSIVLEVGRPMV